MRDSQHSKGAGRRVPDGCRLWFEDSDHIQVSRDGLFVLHTVGNASSANIQRLVASFDAFARSTTGQLGFILQSTRNTRPPDEAGRAAVMDMFRRHAARIEAVAVAMESAGFTGAAARSVVTTMFVLRNPGYPAKVFNRFGDAQIWIASRLGMKVPAVVGVADWAASALAAPNAASG